MTGFHFVCSIIKLEYYGLLLFYSPNITPCFSTKRIYTHAIYC